MYRGDSEPAAAASHSLGGPPAAACAAAAAAAVASAASPEAVPPEAVEFEHDGGALSGEHRALGHSHSPLGASSPAAARSKGSFLAAACAAGVSPASTSPGAVGIKPDDGDAPGSEHRGPKPPPWAFPRGAMCAAAACASPAPTPPKAVGSRTFGDAPSSGNWGSELLPSPRKESLAAGVHSHGKSWAATNAAAPLPRGLISPSAAKYETAGGIPSGHHRGLEDPPSPSGETERAAVHDVGSRRRRCVSAESPRPSWAVASSGSDGDPDPSWTPSGQHRAPKRPKRVPSSRGDSPAAGGGESSAISSPWPSRCRAESTLASPDAVASFAAALSGLQPPFFPQGSVLRFDPEAYQAQSTSDLSETSDSNSESSSDPWESLTSDSDSAEASDDWEVQSAGKPSPRRVGKIRPKPSCGSAAAAAGGREVIDLVLGSSSDSEATRRPPVPSTGEATRDLEVGVGGSGQCRRGTYGVGISGRGRVKGSGSAVGGGFPGLVSGPVEVVGSSAPWEGYLRMEGGGLCAVKAQKWFGGGSAWAHLRSPLLGKNFFYSTGPVHLRLALSLCESQQSQTPLLARVLS